MRVYVNYPTSGVTALASLELLRALQAATACDGTRVVLDWQNPNWRQIADTALTVGAVLPVFDDETSPGYVDQRKPEAFIEWCVAACQAYAFPVVEVLNEPSIIPSHTMSAQTYADTVNRVGAAIHTAVPGPRVAVAVACEALKAGGIQDREGYWHKVNRHLDWASVDRCAIHPYRYSSAPSAHTRVHWPRWAQSGPAWLGKVFGNGDRATEHAAWREAAGPRLIVTEVGWNLADGITQQQQGDRLAAELAFYSQTHVGLVCVYAHLDDPRHPSHRWGVLNADVSPRPAARAIRSFVESR